MAELWFGAHPSGPSRLVVEGHLVNLSDFFKQNPEMVATIKENAQAQDGLPFLFKILSIEQPLSLQAHPDKTLAKILHEKHSDIYPDANHKPELAIALTDFEVMCDFRPSKEITDFFTKLRPLRDVFGGQNCDLLLDAQQTDHEADKKVALKKCLSALMGTEKNSVVKVVNQLLSPDFSEVVEKTVAKLIHQLHRLYPGDPGCLSPFLLNYIKLKPGEAVYLKANTLHSYIKGECLECMANSDNVVRAGLTPKYKDVTTLIDMLDYSFVTDPKDTIFNGKTRGLNPEITTFAPVDDFRVERLRWSDHEAPILDYKLPALSSGSFVVVIRGSAMAQTFYNPSKYCRISLGCSVYLPPAMELELQDIQGDLLLFRAYC